MHHSGTSIFQSRCAFLSLRSTQKQRSHSWRLRESVKSGGLTANECQAVVLDRFWQTRGVANEDHRRHLTDMGRDVMNQGNETVWNKAWDLPGAGIYWTLQWDSNANRQVELLSRKILELHVLLGSRMDLDAGKMIASCPDLLYKNAEDLTERLMCMMATPDLGDTDLGKVIEQQPALLLAEDTGDESVEAWRHGLTSASSQNWDWRLAKIRQYYVAHGDCHIGFRQTDEEDMVKLASMLRHDHRKGTLSKACIQDLENLDFAFDEGSAEWQIMYKQLKTTMAADEIDPFLIAGNADFMLNNWCSVQRISNRAGVLSDEKIKMLDEIDFDWTGADALS